MSSPEEFIIQWHTKRKIQYIVVSDIRNGLKIIREPRKGAHI
jgi:hypothetical protein